MYSDPVRPAKRIIVSSRKTSPLALAVFAIAYIFVLIVVFAPAGSFVTKPADLHAQR